MLTFFIIAAIMAVVLFIDFRSVIKDKQTKITVFYSLITALSLIILALHSFGVDLPGLYGF